MKISIQLSGVPIGAETGGFIAPEVCDAEFSLDHPDAGAVLDQAERFLCSAIRDANGDRTETPSARASILESSLQLRNEHTAELLQLRAEVVQLKEASEKELEGTRELVRLRARELDASNSDLASALTKIERQAAVKEGLNETIAELRENVDRIVDCSAEDARKLSVAEGQLAQNETKFGVAESQLLMYQARDRAALSLIDGMNREADKSKSFSFSDYFATRVEAYLSGEDGNSEEPKQ